MRRFDSIRTAILVLAIGLSSTAVAQSQLPPLQSTEGPVVSSPTFAKASQDDILILDDGDDIPDLFIGVTDSTALWWANEFDAGGSAFLLEEVDFYLRTQNATSNRVYVGVADDQENALFEDTVDLPLSADGSWFTYTFENPILFQENEPFLIAIGVPNGGIPFPAGADDDAPVQGSSYITTDPGVFGTLFNLDQIEGFETRAWLVRAVGELDPTIVIGDQESEPNNTASQANPIEPGDTIEAAIDPSGDVDYFQFSATAGDVLQIDVNNTSGSLLDGRVDLYTDDGALLAWDDGLNRTETIRYAFSVGGTYFIRYAYWLNREAFPNEAGRTPEDDLLGASGEMPDRLAKFSAAQDTVGGYTLALSTSTLVAPTAAVAGTNFDQLVTLEWESPMEGVEHRVYRSTSSSGPFTQVATTGFTDFIDTGLTNGTEYYYRITSGIASTSIESGPSNTVGATPRQGGYLLESSLVSTAPTIDGSIGPSEWDATAISIANPNENVQPVTLRVQNSGQFLYLAIDDENQSPSGYHRTRIYFDLNNDNSFDPTLPSSEGRFFVQDLDNDGQPEFEFRQIAGNYPTTQFGERDENPPGIVAGVSYATGHAVYEIAIDLVNSNLRAAPGATIGVLISTSFELGIYPPASFLDAPATFADLRIGSTNSAPVVQNPIPDQTLQVGGPNFQQSLADVFSDAEGDPLSYTTVSSDPGVATATALFGALVVSPVGDGVTTVTVTAEDTQGGSVSDVFVVTVGGNTAPVVQNPIADQDLQAGGANFQLSLAGVFSDPDGDALSYSASSSDVNVATVIVVAGILSVAPVGGGSATITVTAQDSQGASASESFVVTVSDNAGPAVQSGIADQELRVGGPNYQVSLSGVFSDPDGDPLTYSATSSNTAVASVRVVAGVLSVSAVAAGTATITVTAEDAGGASVSDSFTVTVTSNAAPTITLIDVGPVVPANQDLVISATIRDDGQGVEGTLIYREGGQTLSTSLPMSSSGDTFSATVPASDVHASGLTYEVTAVDTDGADAVAGPRTLRVKLEGDGLTGSAGGTGSAETSYRLVSVPLDLANKNPRNVFEDDFGTYDDTEWRFFALRADQTYAEFAGAGTMDPGEAFWLLRRSGGSSFSTGAGTSVPIDGTFSMTLHAGWNFIGNPFNFPVSTGDLSLQSGSALDLRSFAGSWNTASGSLQPFGGWALFVETSDVLRFLADEETLSKSAAGMDAAAMDWSIKITGRTGVLEDSDNVAGASAAANEGHDFLDKPEPPVIGDFLSVYFPHPEWELPVDGYNVDVRPGSESVDIWRFEIRTARTRSVVLHFDGVEQLPGSLTARLLDPFTGTTLDLTRSPTYELVAGTAPRPLDLVIGRSESVEQTLRAHLEIPDGLALDQNFPNPFNPMTTMRYGLPEASAVSLVVYNARGEEIIRLEDGSRKEAGFHTAIWNGRDRAGREAASGLYVAVLRAGPTTRSVSMVLLR